MIPIVNISSITNNIHDYQHLKLVINICTLLCAIFAIIVSLLVVGCIGTNYLRKKNFKKSKNVSLLLICNTCLAIICSSSTLTLMILSTIGGDLNIYAFKKISLWGCYIRGYLHFAFINSIYLSYVLQAGFRLFRIAFHKYRCLRTIYSFSFYIVTQWITSFLLTLPILIPGEDYSHLIVYLPEEFYCQVPMTSIRGIIFSILSVYFVPVCCIGVIYTWIVIHIRNSRRNFMCIIIRPQRKNKRDSIIIRRICVVMIVLLSLGIPSCLFVISFIINGYLHWAAYRVGWMTISISFGLISLSSLYVTPQIYKPMHIISRRSKKNYRYRCNSSSTNTEIQRKTGNLLLKESKTISAV